MIGWPSLASASQSAVDRPSSARWPAASTTAWLVSRDVAGMPASAAAARPEVRPGMMRKRMPASASAAASSQPRPNTKGSPPFSRSTRRPSAGALDQHLVDVALVRRRPAAALAGRRSARRPRARAQHARIDQRVVHDVVGRPQRMQRQHGEQARIAGAGARQPDLARREVGQIGGKSSRITCALPRKRRW